MTNVRTLISTRPSLNEEELIDWADGVVEALKDTPNLSDGYHTFGELYQFRMLYNAALFNVWQTMGIFSTHKSWRHSDGELCFGGGWFVVVAELPQGQITNHYQAEYWHLFKITESDVAFPWDGHSASDVATRLESYLS